jgi:starvation-inducible outer membrane lipoprotein
MSAAARSIVLLALALSACNEAPKDAETNNAAVTEVEALPADESVTTPTDELANGAAEPQGNETANGY